MKSDPNLSCGSLLGGIGPSASRAPNETGYRFAWVLLAVSLSLGISFNFLLPLRNMDQWFRFFVFGAPIRIGAFALLYSVDRRSNSPTKFQIAGSHFRAFCCAIVMISLWLIFLTQARGVPWGASACVVGAAACLCVGLWEEYLFRGVLLDGLLRHFGFMPALLLDSLMFMVFHTRLQALPSWPHVFLTGAVFANLRVRGVSLGHLALMHAAVDFLFFLHGRRWPPAAGPTYWLFLAGLFIYALVSFPHRVGTENRWRRLHSCQ